ncbi:MAG TPA: hypothetical protein VK171_12365, partial [Fimbriimonas sp.]|nr:hypothetical protein [Fimbriimonas sp.]
VAAVTFPPYSHLWLWVAKHKCKRALKRAIPDQESCVIFFGLPRRLFEINGLFWDVGLVRADGGIQFEGERHTFSLTASQVESTAIRQQVYLGCSEILEIVWRTPSGALSSIFIWDPGANKNPSDSKQWLARVTSGSRPCGPLPVDCSEFPTAPKVQGWGMIALGIFLLELAGLCIAQFEPLESWGHFALVFACVVVGLLVGRRWQHKLTYHRAAKLAVVEPTE